MPPGQFAEAIAQPPLDLTGALEQAFLDVDLQRGKPARHRENMARVGVADIEQLRIEVARHAFTNHHATEWDVRGTGPLRKGDEIRLHADAL